MSKLLPTGFVLRAGLLPWTAFVLLFVFAACNRSAPSEAVAKRGEALTPGPSFTLQLPPQLTSGGAGLISSTTLTLGDRVKVAQPTGGAFAGIVNLGSGLTIIGRDAITGDAWSVGSIQLGDRSTVNGFIKTAGTFTPGVSPTVTGPIQQSQPLTPPTLATVTVQFQNGAAAVPVANDSTRTLSPGDYAAVTLGSRAVLALSTGDYRFDSFVAQLPSTLRLTTTAGPIRIFVRNTLTWNSTVTAAAGDPTKLLLGYVGNAAITINTPFSGTLLSPNAAVSLPTPSSPHSGAFFAKSLSTQPDVIVTAKPFQQPCQGVVTDDGNACTVDACDPNTGVVTHASVANGTTCSDGNACTSVDSCQSGVCVGASPVVCTALDQCHSAGVCAPATGQCTNPNKADGASCSDGSACTQNDSCQAGACVGANPVTCTAQDQCHSVGTCNAATGECSNPLKANGAACSDGTACTQSDTCQAGACVGATPVVCVALDQCHTAGTCSAATGLCSNPVLPDGTSCSDGNACTQSDSCQAGTCTGTSPIACSALDQCHVAGSCDPVSGICSNPTKTDGSGCTDGNACTQSDTCQSGSCVGASPVVCAALDQCHVAGVCSAATGTCSNPPKNDGIACNDANTCTTGETCTAGLCQAGAAVATDDGNPCTADACDPVTGVSHTPVSAGIACDDSNLCNGHETCNAIGFCTATSALPVDDGNPCTADSCDPATGVAHTPVAQGTSCSDSNDCNGVEACSSTGQCTAGAVPTIDDGNPCTADACDPVQGVTHAPVAAGLSCADSTVCNGDERCDALGSCITGAALVVDDGDVCTTDSCDPVAGVSHVAIPNCAAAPGKPFETRASIMGRVIHADGSPAAAFTVKVFNDTLDSVARADVATTLQSDGSFRVRLLEFPQSVAARTPPQAILIRIESEEFPSLLRSAFLRPGDVVTLGDLIVLARDPQVTVVGPEGGTAHDSQGTLELQIPPEALSQPTPIRITPIPNREQFPAPLPSNTVTMYGMEFEPSGTVLDQPATLRVKNTLNLPTSMKIPVGTIDPRFGDWLHVGTAVWDGTRFAVKISHFSPYDVNAGRRGEVVQVVSHGSSRNKTRARTCAASSVNDASGALEQSFDVPLHSASGHDYSLSLHYSTELSGSVAVGHAPPVAPASGSFLRSFATQSIRLACLVGGSGCGSSGGGGGGAPCGALNGRVVMPAYALNQRIKVFGVDVDQSEQVPANGQSSEPLFYVPLPTDEDGNPIRSGFAPFHITSRVEVQGAGTCVSNGGGFGVVGGAFDGAPLRLPVGTGDLSDFQGYQLGVHRRGSALGSGWAFKETSTLFRSPDGSDAEIVRGDGQQESFHRYPQLQKIAEFSNFSDSSLAVDAQTGEVFSARLNFGIDRIDPQSGAVSSIAGGNLFGARQPIDFKITYVDGERRFLVTTNLALFEVGSDGASRKLTTFVDGSSGRMPSVAGVGKFAYFNIGDRTVGTSQYADITNLYRIDLTDPLRAIVEISPANGGELRLDPHGEVESHSFQFLHPSGLAAAFDGGLYVSDDRRHAVYHLAPDDLGAVGPNSVVTRALGSGMDTAVAGPGVTLPALQSAIRAPGILATAPNGVLYIKGDAAIGGLLAFDPVEKTTRWVAFDKSSTANAIDPISPFPNLSFGKGTFAPLADNSVLLSQGNTVYRLSTQLSSDYDPQRTLTFSDTGATVLDTGADAIEQYEWKVGQGEALLIANRRRSGELIRGLTYDDVDHLAYIEDPMGGRVTFGYDGSGRLSMVTDAAQRTTHFTVDSVGNLREVIYPSGEARRFDYEDYRMTVATHPNGEVSTYTYHPDGTVDTATRPGGGVTKIESGFSRGPRYDSNGQLYYESLLTDDRGVQHALSLNEVGGVFEDKYTADGQAYDVKTVYATQLGPDSSPETTTNRLLRFSQTTINGLPVGPFTTYDLFGRPIKVWQSDAKAGFRFAPNFDSNMRLSRLGFFDGGIDEAYTYDAAGHVTKVADVSNGFGNNFPETGRRTTFDGFRTQDGQPINVTSHNIATTLGYDSFGLMSSAVDSVGRSLTVTHDAAGNARSVADGATTLQYGYDLAGRVTSITDAETNITRLSYQTAGCNCTNGKRVTSIATPDLAPDQKWAMTYSVDGDLHTTTTPLNETETYNYNAQRDLTSVVDRAARTTSFTYDQLGRKSTITDPLGRVGTFSYSRATASSWVGPTLYAQSQTATPAPVDLTAALADGQYQVGTNGFQRGSDSSHVALYRDATFQSSQWVAIDSLDNVRSRTDRAGMAFDSVSPGPSYGSDVPFVDEFYGRVGPFGLPKQLSTYESASQGWQAALIRNPDYDLTQFDAGFLGRRASLPSPNSAISVSRDAAGLLTGVSLAQISSSTICYLSNGKLDSVALATPIWASDFTGNICSAPGNAKCTSSPFCYVQSASCVYSDCQIAFNAQQGQCRAYSNAMQSRGEKFQYDARGLTFIRSIPLTSNTLGPIQYGYDPVGRNTTLLFPDGHQRVQIFDALGRLKSRCYQYTDGTPDHCYTTEYDKVGNPHVLTDPGMRQVVEYDELDRVTSVSRFVPANATTPVYVEHYAYNALGSFSVYDGSIVDDQRPRLTGSGKASAGIPASYGGQPITLDTGGRVVAFNGQTFQYYRFNHTLQTRATSTDQQTFTYDSLQRLTNTHTGPPNDQKPNTDESYAYSDLSSSIAAVVTTPHTLDPTPNLPYTNFNVGYDGVDNPLWMTTSDALVYFEVDTIGNVRHLHTDPAVHGSLATGDLGGYSYTAFGKTIAPSDVGGVAAPVGVTQPFRWQGKRLIAPNLYDSRARVWSAELGAFLQPDEYVFLGRSGTLWSWPGQNPFRWRDPSGRFFDGGAAEVGVAAAEAAGGLTAATVVASVAAVGIVGYALYDIYGQLKDFYHPIITYADSNVGKPGPGESCKTDASGGGARLPPPAPGNVGAAAPDPRSPRHHIFPQQYRAEFERAGIDIDEYTIEMSQDEHQALHSNGWNQEWGDFFDETPNPSADQIRNFASELLNEAGLANRPIVPYY